MTEYLKPSFTVVMDGGETYRDNWDAVFGTSDIRKQVEEFHRAFGLPVKERFEVPTADRIKLRLNLIAEEFFELLEACGLKSTYLDSALERVTQSVGTVTPSAVNAVAVADALADLDYVIEGTRLEFGINGKPIAAEVHRSNMSKLGGVPRADGKVTKGPNYSPPKIVL